MKKQKNILIGLVIIVVLSITVFSIGDYAGFWALDPGDGDYTEIPEAPELNSVLSPNTDGSVELSWSRPLQTEYFELWRFNGIGWFLVAKLYTPLYKDVNVADGKIYKYRVIAGNPLGESLISNVISVEIILSDLIYPSNPSIIINNGDLTTNTTELTLTLSCDNADEMKFQILGTWGMWIDYIPYTTTHMLTLTEEYLTPTGTFNIEVVFKNNEGTTEDAGLYNILDDIIYNTPDDGDNGNDNGEDDDNGEEPYDYTLMCVLIGVFVIGIFTIFLVRKKRMIKS